MKRQRWKKSQQKRGPSQPIPKYPTNLCLEDHVSAHLPPALKSIVSQYCAYGIFDVLRTGDPVLFSQCAPNLLPLREILNNDTENGRTMMQLVWLGCHLRHYAIVYWIITHYKMHHLLHARVTGRMGCEQPIFLRLGDI